MSFCPLGTVHILYYHVRVGVGGPDTNDDIDDALRGVGGNHQNDDVLTL